LGHFLIPAAVPLLKNKPIARWYVPVQKRDSAKNFEINEFYLLETGVHLTIVCHSPAAGG
jgi:hypothetical protein